MIWKTSMDRLHKSLDRKLLNKVAQALDQIRELDDVVFDANRNQNTPGKSISIEEIALYEEMLISQKIIPKDKGHYVHRILYSKYCYRLPKQQKKIRYGVYGIYVNNELVYIGMTMRDFEKRWQEHINKIKSGSNELYFYKQLQKYDEEVKLYFKILVDASEKVIDKKSFSEDEVKSMEYALIKVLKPKYNLAGNTYDYHW